MTIPSANSGVVRGAARRSSTARVRNARCSPTRARTRLTPAQRGELRAALAVADFAHLPAHGRPVCCDRFHYRFQHRGWSVDTDEPNQNPGLARVLAVVDEVVSRHR